MIKAIVGSGGKTTLIKEALEKQQKIEVEVYTEQCHKNGNNNLTISIITCHA